MASKAYDNGYKDGLDWDLDGFSSIEDVRRCRDGWDEATINAVGTGECAKQWGVEEETDEFSEACREYNRGAYDGACAPQDQRSGLPPMADDDAPYGTEEML